MSVVRQTILSNPRYPQTITLRRVPAEDAARQLLRGYSISGDEDTTVVGIAYHISETGAADFICLANLTSAFIISFDKKSIPFGKQFSALLCADIDADGENPATFLQNNVRLVGFGMARIAIQVKQATSLHVMGIDLSTLFSPNIREPHRPSRVIAEFVDRSVNRFEIEKLWMDMNGSAERDTVLQAWLAACTGNQHKTDLTCAEKLYTRHINPSEQSCIYQLVSQSDRLESIKPTEVQNDFSQERSNKGGHFELQNTRYKTRVRRSDRTQVVMIDDRGNEFRGTANGAKGKTTTISIEGKGYPKGGLREVKVVGRADYTNSEKARDELIHLIMTGRKTIRKSPFIRRLWFPRWKSIDFESTVVEFDYAEKMASVMNLNDSQRAAMHAMVGDLPLVVVHGPPGTGKTTTIAAVSRIWDLYQLPVWIVAHSNVAVKNIAETLFKKEVDFKLLVSKEFYEEWHEHLYEEICTRLIRSDELPKDKVGMERMISGSSIVLCTLSMLSNPALYQNGTFDIVPPERLIIDEASQINILEFMCIFESFQESLEKVCFFGDPKQLHPHGQEDVPDMKTIFDLEHLKEAGNCHFLNIQYRMPSTIAAFISGFVYDRKLLSQHSIHSPDCLAFIDANRTAEEKVGTSRRNPGEIDVIVNLIKHYYRKLNFCVITPYDAQRAAIQKALENEKLPWETVYNLDSFQGNEADYVLISVVRTAHAGFLHSTKRLNVLLTRCRKGMVIVSSSAFLGFHGSGSTTLLGKLVTHWRTQHPVHKWIDWRSVADASVNLPGVLAPRPPSLQPHTIRPAYAHGRHSIMPSLFTPFSVPGSSSQHQYSVINLDISSQRTFPPLASKMPLLGGSWAASVFSQLHSPAHPRSFIHRRPFGVAMGPQLSQHRGQVDGSSYHAKATYLQAANVSHGQRNNPLRASGYIPNVRQPSNVPPKVDRTQAHQQTQTRTASGKGNRSHSKFTENTNKRHGSKPTTNPSSSGFIRSVTVYSQT